VRQELPEYRLKKARPSAAKRLTFMAFESVVGQMPVDEASLMLQRLPALGRVKAETNDRQFIDSYILDGLRAKDTGALFTMVDRSQGTTAQSGNMFYLWLNRLRPRIMLRFRGMGGWHDFRF
jgi:hypothetical protein